LATSYGETSKPMLAMTLSAGPLSAFPPTMGLTPITGAFDSFKAFLMSEIESMGAMLRIGLLGHIIMHSAFFKASMTPGGMA